MFRSLSALFIVFLSSLVVEISTASVTHNGTRVATLKSERCTGALCRFDPALLGGKKGLPGLRARVNSEMFQYTAQLVGEMLSREIQHARLPKIVHSSSSQSLLDSRFVLHNGYVARYRCPQRVVLGTKSPNRLLVQLQNYDVGINANIAGHLNMMIPMVAESVVPSGVLHIDMSGVILSLEMAIDRQPRGPKLTLVSCSNSIDKIDLSMEKGSSNQTIVFLKDFVEQFVRDVIPNEVCKMIPKIVDEQLNARFKLLPPKVSLTKIAAMTGLELFSSASTPDAEWCTKHCGIIPTNMSALAAASSGVPGLSGFITALSEAPVPKDAKLPSSVSAPKKRPVCSQCPSTVDDPSSLIMGFSKQLNLNKLTDMFLGVKMINHSADEQGMVVDMTGEFSPGGKGGTPFNAFATAFPPSKRDRMIEAIATDYTVNTLLYWAHRKGLISFRITPETPKVGELLRTTCSAVKDDDDDDGESLADLGFCLGDLLPDIRAQMPDKEFEIQIHSTRAPSLLFSAKKNGSATVDIEADADIFVTGTNAYVGTITARVQIEVALQFKTKTIFGSGEIKRIQLSDKTGSLGLSEQALGNIASTWTDWISTMANDALKEGIPASITQSPAQSANFYNFQIKIIEHGLYVAGDMTIAPALLGTLFYSGSLGNKSISMLSSPFCFILLVCTIALGIAAPNREKRDENPVSGIFDEVEELVGGVEEGIAQIPGVGDLAPLLATIVDVPLYVAEYVIGVVFAIAENLPIAGPAIDSVADVLDNAVNGLTGEDY